MKFTSKLLLTLWCMLACFMLTQCAGDSSNPINIDVNGADAYIRLDFSVEGTRADGDITPAENNDITSIDVYIFGDEDILEDYQNIPSEKITAGDDGSSISVKTTSGFKTIYAIANIASGNPLDPEPNKGSTSIRDFQQAVFSSKDGKLRSDNGFMMIGKSSPRQIIKSTADAIPQTNRLHIKLVRVSAMATVESEDAIPALGMTFSNPEFRVCQTSDKMPVEDLAFAIQHDKDESTGLHSDLSIRKHDEITFADCNAPQYMAENISKSHVSGTATFVAISMTVKPQKTYTYATGSSGTPTTFSELGNISTFYTVGIKNPALGAVAYASDSEGSPYCFENSDSAEAYASYLNSQSGSASEYNAIEFSDCKVYYRVNIKTPDAMIDNYGSNSVLRNRHYTISITGIKSLGYSDKAFLFPTDSNAPVDNTDAFLQTTFSIADWDAVTQPTELQ